MARALSQKLAQIAIPLIAAATLGSCASDLGGLGAPLPPQGEVKRPAPYDPFGSSKPADETETQAGLGAKPRQPDAPREGQNTVAKTQMAAVTPLDKPSASTSPIGDGASFSPFAGLTAVELKAQWGAPSLTRTEADAQLMQFKGKGCVVLAYLYPSARGGLETAYAEAHPGGASASAVTKCLGKSGAPRTAGADEPEAAEPGEELPAPKANARPRKPQLSVKPD